MQLIVQKLHSPKSVSEWVKFKYDGMMCLGISNKGSCYLIFYMWFPSLQTGQKLYADCEKEEIASQLHMVETSYLLSIPMEVHDPLRCCKHIYLGRTSSPCWHIGNLPVRIPTWMICLCLLQGGSSILGLSSWLCTWRK